MSQPVVDRTYSKRSLHGQVAHEIGLEIVSGAIPVGSALVKEEVACAQMGVSRTAYREALKVLSAKNVVHSRPKTGTIVQPRSSWSMLDPDLLAWHFEVGPSFQFVRSLYELRMMVEPEGAALAAERATKEQLQAIQAAYEAMCEAGPKSADHVTADVEFHQSILVASGNELLQTLGYLIESGLAKGFELTKFDPEFEAEALRQHGNVAQAIASGDSQTARAEMRKIIATAWSEMVDLLDDEEVSAQSAEDRQDKFLRGLD